MEVYPALRAQMGATRYYIVRMRARDVADKIQNAGEVSPDKKLSDALQRILEKSRAHEGMTNPSERDCKLFSPIVVEATGGEPTFSPVKVVNSEDEAAAVFMNGEIDEVFGALTFYGGQEYHALDGQHQIAAIKSLFENDNGAEKFKDDHVSVIFFINRKAVGSVPA